MSFGQNPARKIIAYLRVSTTAQDVENQLRGITAYAEARKRAIDTTIRDQSTSRLSWRARAIGPLIDDAPDGSVILVSEISRLARSTLEVLEIAAAAAARQHTIIATKNDLVVTGSMESRIMLVMLSLAAEIEREFISSRTKESLARLRAEGRTLGRPSGSKSASKLDKHAAEIRKWQAHGLGKRSIAKLLECSRTTLDSWLARAEESKSVELIASAKKVTS